MTTTTAMVSSAVPVNQLPEQRTTATAMALATEHRQAAAKGVALGAPVGAVVAAAALGSSLCWTTSRPWDPRRVMPPIRTPPAGSLMTAVATMRRQRRAPRQATTQLRACWPRLRQRRRRAGDGVAAEDDHGGAGSRAPGRSEPLPVPGHRCSRDRFVATLPTRCGLRGRLDAGDQSEIPLILGQRNRARLRISDMWPVGVGGAAVTPVVNRLFV
jgi:hypothetical protein